MVDSAAPYMPRLGFDWILRTRLHTSQVTIDREQDHNTTFMNDAMRACMHARPCIYLKMLSSGDWVILLGVTKYPGYALRNDRIAPVQPDTNRRRLRQVCGARKNFAASLLAKCAVFVRQSASQI